MVQIFRSSAWKLMFCFSLFLSSQTLAGFSESETFLLPKVDGSKITYYLQKPKQTRSRGPLLIVLQGSQPDSVYNHGVSNQGIPQSFGAGLLMVEKPGATRGSKGCSPEYKSKNDLTTRIQDIKTVLNHLKNEKWWNRELVVLGGSEGGDVAVKLTAIYPVKKAILLVTGAGMTMAESMPTIIRDSMKNAPESEIQKAIAKLPEVFVRIASDPASTESFFGECNTYKYWNSIMWFRPVDTMLVTQTKYLLIHGDRDASHPVASARMTAARFKRAAPHRLVYWEFTGLDHALSDQSGKSHMPRIMSAALKWLFQ